MFLMQTAGLFILTALAEIVGCFYRTSGFGRMDQSGS